MADLEQLGDDAGWRCWICDLEVPRRAKANDPNQAVADQVAPAAKGSKGRGVLRLAHKRCNDARKGRPPRLPWPDRFAVVDAPDLLASLARLAKRPGGRGEVVGMFVDEASAEGAARWVVPVAATLHPGDWSATTEAVASMAAVRLVVR